MKKTLVCALMFGVFGLAFAQPAIDAERSRIAAERSRAQAAFAVEDGACYKRFWVNVCLAEVKARRIEIFSDLRRQEVALNDQERRAQGAEQLQKIEEKQSLAQQQAQADASAVAANRLQSKIERDAQKTQGLISPEVAQAAKAQANKASAANRALASKAKLANRNEKEALRAQEVQTFEAKQARAKVRQDRNKAEQNGKTKAAPLPPQPSDPSR